MFKLMDTLIILANGKMFVRFFSFFTLVLNSKFLTVVKIFCTHDTQPSENPCTGVVLRVCLFQLKINKIQQSLHTSVNRDNNSTSDHFPTVYDSDSPGHVCTIMSIDVLFHIIC